jgi:hypothetical protein
MNPAFAAVELVPSAKYILPKLEALEPESIVIPVFPLEAPNTKLSASAS